MNKKQLMLVLAGLSVISNIQSSDNGVVITPEQTKSISMPIPGYLATGTAAMSNGFHNVVDAAKAHPYYVGAAGIGAAGGLAYLAYIARNPIKNGLNKALNVAKENKVKTALVATSIAAGLAYANGFRLPAAITENETLIAAATKASQALSWGSKQLASSALVTAASAIVNNTVLATSAPVVSTPAATANALPVPVVSTPVATANQGKQIVRHGKTVKKHGKTVKKHGKKAHGKKAKKGHGKRK